MSFVCAFLIIGGGLKDCVVGVRWPSSGYVGFSFPIFFWSGCKDGDVDVRSWIFLWVGRDVGKCTMWFILAPSGQVGFKCPMFFIVQNSILGRCLWVGLGWLGSG